MAEGDNDHGNGWTQYQRLVLDTLTRHDKKLEDMNSQLVDQKISFSRMQAELEQSLYAIQELIEKLEETKKAQAANVIEFKELKWKFGAVVTTVSTIAAWGVQAAIKFFLHS